MKSIDYDKRLHVGYHAGRAHDESVMQLWRETLRRRIGNRDGLMILDLGSGTGRFSALLADEFNADVIGVEPSDRMRAVAESECRHPRVRFVSGAADRILLPDSSCDVAWLSQIIHHVPDIEAAARELRRVVRTPGRVIIRNNFKGRLSGCCLYYEFFPTGLAVDEQRHPTVEQVERCFTRHGFRRSAFETIEQMESSSLREYAERIRQRPYSTFELITDHEYAAGLAALQEAASRELEPRPVMGKMDLLVMEQSARSSMNPPRWHSCRTGSAAPRRQSNCRRSFPD